MYDTNWTYRDIVVNTAFKKLKVLLLFGAHELKLAVAQ